MRRTASLFFCYDSNAPDALEGGDLHKKDMHCDKLTTREIKACPANAVQGVSAPQTKDDTQLYSTEIRSSTSESEASTMTWAATGVLSALALAMVITRVLVHRTRDDSDQNVEMFVAVE
jgi:hypothetical protein